MYVHVNCGQMCLLTWMQRESYNGLLQKWFSKVRRRTRIVIFFSELMICDIGRVILAGKHCHLFHGVNDLLHRAANFTAQLANIMKMKLFLSLSRFFSLSLSFFPVLYVCACSLHMYFRMHHNVCVCLCVCVS